MNRGWPFTWHIVSSSLQPIQYRGKCYQIRVRFRCLTQHVQIAINLSIRIFMLWAIRFWNEVTPIEGMELNK